MKFVCDFDIRHDCVLKGVEILTQAKKFAVETSARNSKRTRQYYLLNPELLFTDDSSFFFISSRLNTKVEYDEGLRLRVKVIVNDEVTTLVADYVRGKKQYISWFYYAFEEKIVFLKGTKCSIQVCPMREASYLLIGPTQVKDLLRAAQYVWQPN